MMAAIFLRERDWKQHNVSLDIETVDGLSPRFHWGPFPPPPFPLDSFLLKVIVLNNVQYLWGRER